MYRRSALTSAALALVVAVSITACGGSSKSHSPSSPSSIPATTGRPTGTPTSTTTSLSILVPNPASPAVRVYGTKVVTEALNIARSAAYASFLNPKLSSLSSKDKLQIQDYAANTRYLSKYGLALFAKALSEVLTHHDAKSKGYVTAFALGGSQFNFFSPDTPPRFGPTKYKANPTVNLSTSTVSHRTEMMVSGSIVTGYIGTVRSKHGTISVSRTFTYYLTPTGDPSQPVAIDTWTSRYLLSDKVK